MFAVCNTFIVQSTRIKAKKSSVKNFFWLNNYRKSPKIDKKTSKKSLVKVKKTQKILYRILDEQKKKKY